VSDEEPEKKPVYPDEKFSVCAGHLQILYSVEQEITVEREGPNGGRVQVREWLSVDPANAFFFRIKHVVAEAISQDISTIDYS